MKPNAEELKALRQFVSTDETRDALATLWEYADETGCTHIASDGHTLAMRNAGSHVTKSIFEIEKLPPKGLDNANAVPKRWSSVFLLPDCTGKNVANRGINPAYFARVALVERAAGRRAASDYKPKPGTSKKLEKLERANLVSSACSIWSIGSDVLAAWYWKIPGDQITWQGLIMPRRV